MTRIQDYQAIAAENQKLHQELAEMKAKEEAKKKRSKPTSISSKQEISKDDVKFLISFTCFILIVIGIFIWQELDNKYEKACYYVARDTNLQPSIFKKRYNFKWSSPWSFPIRSVNSVKNGWEELKDSGVEICGL